MRRLIVVIAALAAGCGLPGSWLPTRALPDLGGPAALIYGTLVDVDGCVYVESPDKENLTLVVWPVGSHRSGSLILDIGGTPIAKVGQPIVLGGGEALPPDGAPEGCATDPAWGAHSVNPSLPPGVIPTPPY